MATKKGFSYYTKEEIDEGANFTIIGTTTGDNRNYAIKYNDGRLICIQKYTFTGVTLTAWGSMYSGALFTPVDYAVPFKEVPVISATPITNGSNYWLATRVETGGSTKTRPQPYQAIRPTTVSSISGAVEIVAYGFWK